MADPTTTVDPEEQQKERLGIPPVAGAMAMPVAVPAQPAAPPAGAPPPVPASVPPIAPAPAPAYQPGSAVSSAYHEPNYIPPMPAPEQSGTARLMQRAEQIKRPALRIPAEIGAGILRGADVGAEALLPRAAMAIPGSELHTEMANQERAGQAMKMAELQQKPELAELKGEITGEIKAGEEAARHQDVAAQQTGAGERTAATQAGAMARTQAEILGREDITKMENENKTAIAAGKAPPHITIMQPDGKGHVMERDPQTGAYTVDRGEAPPNYAQIAPSLMQTKTVELLGGDNVMHRFAFNPSTMSYDTDLGAAPTGAAAHQIFQAGAIENLAPQVIADINANRDILGKLSSYYKQWLAGTPVADPKAAGLMSELMSLSAMQPALHAFRSSTALEAFEKMVGGLGKNPDATIATINGLLKTPEAFTNMAQGGGAKTASKQGQGVHPKTLPDGAIPGTLKGKHGYVLNGKFHAD